MNQVVIKVTGEKSDKVAAARTLWIPAENNHAGFGRWAFIEIDDPWNVAGIIQADFAGKIKP